MVSAFSDATSMSDRTRLLLTILMGVVSGLLAGLAAVVLDTLGGTPPPDAPGRCIRLMVALLVVGGLCGGAVSWRLGRSRSPKRRWPRQRR